MKKLLILAALTFAGFFIVNNFNGDDELKVVANNTTLPFKIAMLAAKEPEAQIAMPVRAPATSIRTGERPGEIELSQAGTRCCL